MQKASLQQAVKMTGKSESTLRRDVKKGKVSASRDDRGHIIFDQAELRRVYGELKSTGEDAESTAQANDKAITGHAPRRLSLYLRTKSRISSLNWKRRKHDLIQRPQRKSNCLTY